MDEMKSKEQIIAENLAYYRKAAGLTQLEIADKFNYSDKSISKWERGEGLPDVLVLKSLADFYGIQVDDFFNEEKKKTPLTKKSKHYFIVGLSELLLWLVFAVVFVLFAISPIKDAFPWWLIFIYATAASSILAVVWSGVYHNELLQLIATSGIIWLSITSLFLTLLLTTTMPMLWLLYLVGIPLQGLAVLWYFLKRNSHKK